MNISIDKLSGKLNARKFADINAVNLKSGNILLSINATEMTICRVDAKNIISEINKSICLIGDNACNFFGNIKFLTNDELFDIRSKLRLIL